MDRPSFSQPPFVVESDLQIAFLQVEQCLSIGGGHRHPSSARVLGRGWEYHCRESSHNEFIENIETQVAEVLTKFGEGNTVVMLQFRTQDVPFKTSFTKMKKKMRGGSLTGFLPDKSQYGSRVFTDMLKGGLKVLKTLETP